jgi:hypothetical protein
VTGVAFGDIPAGCLCAWTGAPGGGWIIESPSWYGLRRKPRERCPVQVPAHQPHAAGVPA